MRKPMSKLEFWEVMRHVHAANRFGKGGRHIKYVSPTFDMRNGDIHSIEFRGVENKTFSITNENKDRDLYEWVMDWLLVEEDEAK